MENKKSLSAQLISILGEMAFIAVKKTVRGILYVDRKFWKAYFSIETPLYKAWWANHAEWMQKKLNEVHSGYAMA